MPQYSLTFSTGAVLLAAACSAPEKLDPIDLDAADGPTAADFSSEEDLLDRYADEIEAPFLALEEGSFEGVDGGTIRYRINPVSDAKATVVFLTGRTEPILKHAETFFDLEAQGYQVYAMDHRGHGASDRMLDNPDICHVEYFQDYVDDLATFVDSVVLPAEDGPLFVMSHSMGGAVVGLYLHQNPDLFDGAVFGSPMFGIDTGVFPLGIAQTLSYGTCSSTSAEGYTIGHGDYDPEAAFEDNLVTHSEVRYQLKMQMFDDHVDLRVGGASWRWVCESLWAAENVQRLGRHTPTRALLLQAGDEQRVLPDDQTSWCDEAPGCQQEVFDSAYHELYAEADEHRNEALAKTVRFFDALLEAK